MKLIYEVKHLLYHYQMLYHSTNQAILFNQSNPIHHNRLD
jgi:hypothetical protein